MTQKSHQRDARGRFSSATSLRKEHAIWKQTHPMSMSENELPGKKAPMSPSSPFEALEKETATVSPKLTKKPVAIKPKEGMFYVLEGPGWWDKNSQRKRRVVYTQSGGLRGRYLSGRGPNGFVYRSYQTALPRDTFDAATSTYQRVPWEKNIIREIKPSPIYQLAHFHNSNGHVSSSGCDPEFFAVDSNGEIIPAFKYLPPKKGPTGAPYYLYADGFAGEITPAGGGCLQGLEQRIASLLISANAALHKFDPKARLTLQNTVSIHPSLMEDASDEDVALGCMPSQNAYDAPPITFEHPRLQLLRSAGGHIHFAIQGDKQNIARAIRGLDAIVGVACVSLFAKFDTSERRRFYGRAGEYRTPSYGLEYRVLSNAWLAHPKIYHLVFSLARCVTNIGLAGLVDLWEATQDEVRQTIDTHDVSMAHKILFRNERIFHTILRRTWQGYPSRAIHASMAVFYDGLQSVVEEPDNLERNWQLKQAEAAPYTSWGTYADHQYPIQL